MIFGTYIVYESGDDHGRYRRSACKKYKNWWSQKMLKILQRKMQFEKCFFLRKIFEITQKIFCTENANDAATIRHLEV